MLGACSTDRGEPPCPYKIWCGVKAIVATPILVGNRNKLWMTKDKPQNVTNRNEW